MSIIVSEILQTGKAGMFLYRPRQYIDSRLLTLLYMAMRSPSIMRLRAVSVFRRGYAHPHLYLRRYGYTTDNSDSRNSR